MQFCWAPREGLPCPLVNQAETLRWTLNSEFRSTGKDAEAEDTDVGIATVGREHRQGSVADSKKPSLHQLSSTTPCLCSSTPSVPTLHPRVLRMK